METRDTLYIGGEWVAPAGTETIEVISPATEEVIARVPEASPSDIDAAVEAARAALAGPYPQLSPDERAEMITTLSQAIQGRAQEFADTITREMGSPSSWALMGQVLSSTMVLDGWAELTRSFPFEEIRPGALGPVMVRKEPVGVSAGIIPWNVPLFIVTLKLGAALAAGCPMILKPSPETPLDGYLPPEDPLRGVARQIEATGRLKTQFPGMVIVGSAYSYLQEWLPNVAQRAVARGDVKHALALKLVLRHFVRTHPDRPSAAGQARASGG